MRKYLGTAAIVALAPAMAGAVGLDRSGQPIDLIFEDGNYTELSFGRVFPSVDGEDVAILGPGGSTLVPGGNDSGNVAENFSTIGFGVKYEFDERLSFSVSFDQPYGSDVVYPDGGIPGEEGSLTLGGTRAIVDSRGLQALARYKLNENLSVHGGLRYQEIQADVTLSGAGYGGISGYRVSLESDGDLGYVIGAAYERPEIALRVALTYISGTTHEMPTTETLNGVNVSLLNPAFSPTSTTTVETPEAVHLDFQTGIAADTLLFGSIRYARYEDTLVSPDFFDANVQPTEAGTSLTDIDNNYEISLGVGRRLTDKLSGSVTLEYQPSRDDLVSPLAPTNGSRSVALGLAYDVTEQFTVSGGIRYSRLGDALPETGTPDVARADFEDNDVVAVGLQLGYRF